jgi:hypothetical protein
MKFLISLRIILCVLLALLHTLICAQDANTPPLVINGVSLPANFPRFTATINEETAPGQIFITNREGIPYLMILNNNGTPYFYQLLEDHSLDFKVQANGMLTRWIGEDIRAYVVMDTNFQNLDTLRCQNGFDTDEHELQLLPNGHALMIAVEERNLSEIDPDGNPNTIVLGNHIQELDENGSVVFEWLCWDYFQLEDSFIENFDALRVDYVHINSIAVDFDGNILISSRHLSECTKINRQTGEIIWRLGGKNNQFNFINDPDQISYQHDFRPVPGKPGHYTLFDNGNQKDPHYSRALEFKLDTDNMTAEKVWEYRHYPDRYSRLMGNAQRLPNGNTLINWGDPALPKITELTPDSVIVFEADFTPAMNNYRTFRFEFEGYMLAPNLIAEPYPDRVRLIFNKFGDEGVDYFNVYGGENPDLMEWIDSSSLTWIDLFDLEDSEYYYLEVTAVDTSGLEGAASNREKVYVRNCLPGDNLIINGDFSDDDSFWIHKNIRQGVSYGSVSDSTYRFHIENAGLLASDVQLYQTDIPLIKGKEYILELDARADAARFVNIELGRAGLNWTSYSRLGQIYITQQFKHIEHTFIMEELNDLKANLVINGGVYDIDFEVKNISLRQTVISGTSQKDRTETDFLCHPNPVNKELYISFQLESTSDIHLQLFTLSGQVVETLYQGRQVPGSHEIHFNTEKLADGAYMLYLQDGSSRKSVIVLVQH